MANAQSNWTPEPSQPVALAVGRRLAHLQDYLTERWRRSVADADICTDFSKALRVDFDSALIMRAEHDLAALPWLKGTERWDTALVSSVVSEWQPAVNAVIQNEAKSWARTARKLVSRNEPDIPALRKYLRDSVRFFFELEYLRPLTSEELGKINLVIDAALRTGQDLETYFGGDFSVRAVPVRLGKLFDLYREIATTWEWEAARSAEFAGLLTKTAKTGYPNLARFDQRLLGALVTWVDAVQREVVAPAMAKYGTRAPAFFKAIEGTFSW